LIWQRVLPPAQHWLSLTRVQQSEQFLRVR
jgi:hypothetical protein